MARAPLQAEGGAVLSQDRGTLSRSRLQSGPAAKRPRMVPTVTPHPPNARPASHDIRVEGDTVDGSHGGFSSLNTGNPTRSLHPRWPPGDPFLSVAASLEERARMSRRSLQQEFLRILEKAVAKEGRHLLTCKSPPIQSSHRLLPYLSQK